MNHPFEKARLGLAPFQFVYMTIETTETGQPASRCSYCREKVKYECHIESHDEKEFVVGHCCLNRVTLEYAHEPN